MPLWMIVALIVVGGFLLMALIGYFMRPQGNQQPGNETRPASSCKGGLTPPTPKWNGGSSTTRFGWRRW